MNYSLNEIVESIAERAGRQYDIPFRYQVKLWVGLWRARLMRDSLERNPQDRVFFITAITLPLEIVEEFPTCGIVRRTPKVRQPLRANSRLFDYVGSPNLERSFPIVPTQNIPFLKASTYTGHSPKAAWVDNYLYIFNAPHMKEVRIHGIFDDVSDLYTDEDAPYPVSLDIAQRIIQSILTVELRMPADPDKTEINLNTEDNDRTQKRNG